MVTRQMVIEATKKSAQKWRAIQAGKGFDAGMHNCELCKLFYEAECVGCPIDNYTKDCCDGSPYKEWLELTWEDDDIFLLDGKGYAVFSNKAAHVAGEMASFIESVILDLENNKLL